MFDNKESVGFLAHRGHSRLIVIAVFGVLAQLAIFGAYDNVGATSNNDDDRELDVQCKTGNEDVCLIAACMGHPCVWYQNSSGGIERNFDVSITEYNPPGLDTLDEDIVSKVVKVDDGCMESTSNIKLISTSRMDDATSVNSDDNEDDDDDKDDDNNNDSIFAKLLDNDYDTKWEEEGFGSFIQADLGSVEPVCNVGIAWDNGDERSYNFVISTSRDGTTFTDTLRGTSSGTTEALETYDLTNADSRFIRITVFGNNDDNNDEDDTAAINEIRVGTSTTGGSQVDNNSSSGQSEMSEGSLISNNNTSLSSNSTEITPENYISEITDLMVAEGYEDRLQMQFTDTNLPPSVRDLNIKAASVSSLEIELKGSDLSSPDGLDYSVVDLPTHGVLKAGTDQDRVLYYPHPGYVGSDSFTYKAIDDHGLESSLGTVDITIEGS